jgi:hypothetical protein
MMKNLLFTITLLLLAGCSTVTINPKGTTKLETEPTYEKSLPFFLVGIIGEKEVDVKAICGGRAVKQIQTQNTFLDSFLEIVTLTIYSPRSIKVWCDEGVQNEKI